MSPMKGSNCKATHKTSPWRGAIFSQGLLRNWKAAICTRDLHLHGYGCSRWRYFFFLQPLPTLDTPELFFSLLGRKLESQKKKKKTMRGWTAEMGSKLKALAVLTEDPSSQAPHLGDSLPPGNPSSRAAGTLLEALSTCNRTCA